MSFININNKQENVKATYSAFVIREALLSIETKDAAKADAIVESIEGELTLNEALEFFSAKLKAMNALNVALLNEAAQEEWVGYIEYPKGKKLEKTFKTSRAANTWSRKNMDDILSQKDVESIGTMSKKEWDKHEAKYALTESLNINEGTMSEIHMLAKEAKNIAEFTKKFFKEFGDKIKKTTETIEWVESLYTDVVAESLVTERSINKIQKEFSEVVNDMTTTVANWKTAEGDTKIQLLDKLKALTARKTELTSELDSAVMGKDKDAVLSAIEESVVTEAKIKITKNEWPYLEFKDGGKTHKVEFDYEDIIDDHGNEGQDQYWLGKDDNGQEWMIDVYASSNGDVEEVHYDTIVKESVVTEGLDKNKPYFDFLVALRDSGATNMFGATPYLQDAFDLSKSEARKILAEWMKSFNEAKTNEATVVMDAMDPGSLVSEASSDLKVGDSGVDYNDNVVEIIAIGRFAKIAKMFKKETKEDAEDYGIEELMVNTDYYLTKNIESPEGNVGDYYIYPVRYDMANYWGLDPLDESVANEAFSRMSKDAIENELYSASQELSKYYDWLKAGNDSGKGKTLDSIISLLKKCKSSIKRFNKPEEVKGTAFESFEAEETPSWNNLMETINYKLNEDLRRGLKKYIKQNEDELNKLADEDAFDTIYDNIRAEFDITEGTKEDRDMIETFKFMF